MIVREVALQTLFDRLLRDRNDLNLKALKWNSNDPISKDMVPSIYMYEELDEITARKSRDSLGYPVARRLEVELEIVTTNDKHSKAVKDLYLLVRRTVFCEKNLTGAYTINPVLAPGSTVRELRAKGPGLYDVPELVGIKMVLEIQYIDNGIEL